jgi:hypothetical protein
MRFTSDQQRRLAKHFREKTATTSVEKREWYRKLARLLLYLAEAQLRNPGLRPKKM